MSFILDALKKVERQRQQEKQAQGDESSLVSGGRPWVVLPRLSLAAIGILLAVIAVLIAALAFFHTPDGRSPTAPGKGAVASTEPAALDTVRPDTPSVDAAAGADRLSEPSPPPTQPAIPESTATAVATPVEEPEELAPEIEVGSVPPVRLRGPRAQELEATSDVPPGQAPEGLPNLILQGTAVVDGRPVAVVNFQRVFEGDVIEDAKVIRISDRVVELEFKGKRFTITL